MLGRTCSVIVAYLPSCNYRAAITLGQNERKWSGERSRKDDGNRQLLCAHCNEVKDAPRSSIWWSG